MAEYIKENRVESASPKGDGKEASAVSEKLKCSPLPEQKKSSGEKAYNLLTYTGIGFVANWVVSVLFADFYVNGRGKIPLNSYIKNTAIKVADLGIMSLKNSHQISSAVIKTMALSIGGWLSLIPTKLLEDNKRDIVHKANDALGVEQTAADGHKLTPDEIHIEKEQPKQNWGDMLKRRLEVTIAVVGSALAIDKLFTHPTRMNHEQRFKIDGKEIKFDAHPVGGLQAVSENILKPFNIKNRVIKRILELFFVEAVFTGIAATVMYLTNGATKAKMPLELDCSQDPKAHEEKNKIVPDVSEVKADVEESNGGHFTSKVAKREITKIEKKEIKPTDYINRNSQGAVSIGG